MRHNIMIITDICVFTISVVITTVGGGSAPQLTMLHVNGVAWAEGDA